MDQATTDPKLQALIDEVKNVRDANEIANAAPSVEITVDGKTVKHLNIKLSADETRRVMQMPVEMRAVMATNILKERRLAAAQRKVVGRATTITKRIARDKRKRVRNARRRNR